MNTGIYEIVNSVNGNRYVGSAINCRKRWEEHRSSLQRGNHSNRHLQRAWTKHGKNNFIFRKLLICSKEALLMYEQRAIDVLKPEYNIAKRAGNTLGVKPTAEKIAKLSAANMGKRPSAETRAKLSAARIGRRYTFSQSAIERIRAGIRNRNNDYLRTTERREKVAKQMQGNKYALGLKFNAEALQKIAAASRLAHANGKLSTAQLHTEEARAKHRETLKNKTWVFSRQHRARISATLRLREAQKRARALIQKLGVMHDQICA